MECNLILHARTLDHTIDLLEEVKSLGVEAYAVAAELSDLDSVEKMLKTIDEKGFGRIVNTTSGIALEQNHY